MVTDQELEAVKRALSQLKGETIFTMPRGKTNHIDDISEDKGFYVRATARPLWVGWDDEVLAKYKLLRSQGRLAADQSKRNRGAFVMPLLEKLSTVEWCHPPKNKRDRPPLCYRPDGLPVRLKG